MLSWWPIGAIHRFTIPRLVYSRTDFGGGLFNLASHYSHRFWDARLFIYGPLGLITGNE